jgi:hypothetical protein
MPVTHTHDFSPLLLGSLPTTPLTISPLSFPRRAQPILLRALALISPKPPLGSACHLLSSWPLPLLILRPWKWRPHVPPERRLAFSRLHDLILQKTELFTTTAVRISNLISMDLLQSRVDRSLEALVFGTVNSLSDNFMTSGNAALIFKE